MRRLWRAEPAGYLIALRLLRLLGASFRAVRDGLIKFWRIYRDGR